jgi:hypothetical protein
MDTICKIVVGGSKKPKWKNVSPKFPLLVAKPSQLYGNNWLGFLEAFTGTIWQLLSMRGVLRG